MCQKEFFGSENQVSQIAGGTTLRLHPPVQEQRAPDKLAGAGLERSAKRHLFPKEVITPPYSLQDVMLEFPLSPKAENPRVLTKHKQTVSILGGACVGNECRGKGLRASLVHGCPAVLRPLPGTVPWDPVGPCAAVLMEGMASSSPQNLPRCKTDNKIILSHLLSGS